VEQHAKQESYERQNQPLTYQAYEHSARTVEHASEELGLQTQCHTIHDDSHEQHQQPVSRPVEVDGKRIQLLQTFVHTCSNVFLAKSLANLTNILQTSKITAIDCIFVL
jgi:hypothetical protein